MKSTLTTILVLVTIGVVVSLALGQMLPPKHPGYPMDKAVSPVTGQPLANDPGQANAIGEKALTEAAGFDDARSVQDLSDPNNERLLKSIGAGLLPKVEGPDFRIDPPVKEGTRMK